MFALLKFQDKGDLFVSLDGNFGLVHKQNSGTSKEPPQIAESLFLDQSKLNEFVKTYDTSSKVGEGVRFIYCLHKFAFFNKQTNDIYICLPLVLW